MRILAFDPYAREAVDASDVAEWAEIDELVAESDFVSLHPLLTEETRHLIDERRLRAMKPTAYLVNAARGPVVDEEALVRALREGWIAGAGLDVYEREPAMAEGLAELDNVVLLPHIASASVDTRGMMAWMAADNAVAFLRRERAHNPVNPDVYETEAYRRRTAGT
jgi:glyoxylate reductase